MTMVLMQTINSTILAQVGQTLVDELIAGALAGIVIGILVGAIIMPVIQAPDTMGRAVFFSIMAAVLMSLYQLARIGRSTGEQLGTILSAFAGPYTDNMGAMILNGIVWVLYSMLAGALVGVASQTPDKVIKGGIVGLFLGAAVGAGLHALLLELNVHLGALVNRILIAGLTWALFTVIVGGSED